MTDNLPGIPVQTPVESIIPEAEVIRAPEVQPAISPSDSTSSITPSGQPLQQGQNAGDGIAGIVDLRTGHEELDSVSTIADDLTQAADKEEAEFIQGVEDEHNPAKPKI